VLRGRRKKKKRGEEELFPRKETVVEAGVV
jgi:hypothetical protein